MKNYVDLKDRGFWSEVSQVTFVKYETLRFLKFFKFPRASNLVMHSS